MSAQRRQSAARAVAAASAWGDRTRRIEALVAESRLAPLESRRILSELVTDLRIEMEAIRLARARGKAKADEVRVYASLARNVSLALDRLGLTAEDAANLQRRKRDEDDEDDS